MEYFITKISFNYFQLTVTIKASHILIECFVKFNKGEIKRSTITHIPG